MTRYLLEDFTGVASGIHYGKKGDQVSVISEREGIALVDNGKELFHIRVERLSESKPEINNRPEPVKPVAPASVKRKSGTRTMKQKKLF